MKITALMGSPRKHGNTAAMLERFLEGVRSEVADADIRRVDVYDLKASGCRSCYGCRLFHVDPGHCIVKDDAYEVLKEIRESDGFVIASPIYWWEITAELKCVLERLFYSMITLPKEAKKKIQTAAIYTMNQPKEVMEKRFSPLLDPLELFMEDAFIAKPERVCAFETLHFDKPDKFIGFTEKLYEERKGIHDTVFPRELETAYEAGTRMAQNIML